MYQMQPLSLAISDTKQIDIHIQMTMRKWGKRSVRLGCLALLMLLVLAGGFYGRYGWISYQLEQQKIPPQQVNAIKHALAAYETYQMVAWLLPDRASESLVISLGNLSEQTERITKYGQPDPLSEVLKDLHNNYVGIVAAQWVLAQSDNKQENKQTDSLALIVKLSQRDGLINRREVMEAQAQRLSGDSDDSKLALGNCWLRGQQAVIQRQTQALLAKAFAH